MRVCRRKVGGSPERSLPWSLIKVPVPYPRVYPVQMLMLAGLAVFSHFTKQSTITAALIVGIIFAGADLPTHHETVFESEVIVMLNEFGMAMVLFFSGISVDVNMLRRYSHVAVLVGAGMVISCTGLFSLVAWGTGLCEEGGSIIFFGVACSLSCRGLLQEFEARNGSTTFLDLPDQLP